MQTAGFYSGLWGFGLLGCTLVSGFRVFVWVFEGLRVGSWEYGAVCQVHVLVEFTLQQGSQAWGLLVGPRLHLGSTRRAMDALLEAKKLETL